MQTTRIHAVEGSMIASLEGLEQLASVVRMYDNPAQVFVISPLREGSLSFTPLLTSAAGKDERLWSRLEKSPGTALSQLPARLIRWKR